MAKVEKSGFKNDRAAADKMMDERSRQQQAIIEVLGAEKVAAEIVRQCFKCQNTASKNKDKPTSPQCIYNLIPVSLSGDSCTYFTKKFGVVV